VDGRLERFAQTLDPTAFPSRGLTRFPQLEQRACAGPRRNLCRQSLRTRLPLDEAQRSSAPTTLVRISRANASNEKKFSRDWRERNITDSQHLNCSTSQPSNGCTAWLDGFAWQNLKCPRKIFIVSAGCVSPSAYRNQTTAGSSAVPRSRNQISPLDALLPWALGCDHGS